MPLTVSENIRIILGRRNLSITDLAQKMETSRQNLTNKLNRDNFSEKEIRDIANFLDCDFDAVFTFRDSGEKI